MIAFFVAILAFVWTTGDSTDHPTPPHPRIELLPRLLVTALFLLGLLYFAFVVLTFQRYGGARPPLDDAPPVTLQNISEQNGAGVVANGVGLAGAVGVGAGAPGAVHGDLEKGSSLEEERGRRAAPRL